MDRDNALLKVILDNIEDGIYVISKDYSMEFMNRAMVRMFGEGVGKKCHEVLNSSSDICPWCRADQIFKGQSLSWELYLPKVDRTFFLKEMPFENPDGTTSKLSVYRDITRRKQREARIKASVEEYRTLFEHVAVGVYISTKEGKFVDANQAMVDMLGYDSKEDFLNIDISKDLYLFPEDRLMFQEMIERDGRVIDYEVQFKRQDGSPIPVLMTSHVRYDQDGNVVGYEGINVDQSQRYQMERKLREAHDFMNKIVQSAPISIMSADLKGNIIIWNRAAEATLGYSAAEVIGRMHITRIYPEGKAFEIMKVLRSPEDGGVGVFPPQPVLYVRQDGKIIEGHLSAAMIYDDDGNEVATVGSFVDLTERIEMERALSKTQEQLLQSEKLAAMGRLTSQVAHELNNPLYGIMNTLELLKTVVPPEHKRRKLLDMSLSEIERLADMLKKMLSFSKPEQEIKKPVDVNVIIDEILMLHEKQLQEHSIKLKTEFAENLAQVYASTNQLRQVFLNMVSNARDAMPEGGVLTVRTFGDNGFIKIQFADTGIGIRPENLDKIFDSFFTTKASVKGVGLGLSVCYGFIKDHGGDIVVTSKLGEGATFTIQLPVLNANN
ncbi:MAG: PAS domain-containing sensor histidine kinase [Desulfobacterales bacterium CG23_combo_of_CG06-09_8_20_14_all_51_8]|nr:MAG: PAS domain-containing sensor histidine kinase [Desulfobacterales bacterium CG23_combo_of_CG06-09_8_20_14_all_51_8]